MPDTRPDPDVQHNPARQRFEATVEGHVNVVDYRLHGQVMRITHTEVNPALEGRGIGAALVKAALDHARSQGLKVDPQCPYARAYMQRHPETLGLLA